MPNTRIYWLHALSPTHVGTGRGVGYIDLPIDRDGVTNWPVIRASTFKGVWANHYKATEDARKNCPQLKAAFGLADSDNSNSGALIPTDAQIVCLPVRSFRGTFAWVTSPLCLQMFRRTLALSGVTEQPSAPADLVEGEAHHTKDTALVEPPEGTSIYLEDLDFKGVRCETATKWAKWIGDSVFGTNDPWTKEFQKRFVVIPNTTFDFLCETATEVQTRVKIDDDMKVVVKGALWTEESLPAETILAGIIQCERVFQKKDATGTSIDSNELISAFATKPLTLQIGGKATVGRGRMQCVFAEEK